MNNLAAEDTGNFWTKLETAIGIHEKVLAWLLVLICFFYIPIKITSYNWVPYDDALRHAAHGVNEKTWGDVVVIRPEYDIDHNPGWHSILRFMHRAFDLNQDDLLLFSVIGLYLLFNITGALLSPRPLAWAAAMIALALTDSSATYRVIIGRPYLVSSCVTLLLLSLWTRPRFDLKSWRLWVVSIAALSLAVWIHGSWYLFLLVPLAFFLAGQGKRAGALLLCILAGTLIGASLSGEPIDFLRFHLQAPFEIFGEKMTNRQLVTEFQAGTTVMELVAFCAILALLLQQKGRFRLSDLTSDPVFLMAATCWLLGIMVNRFWVDWGRVAISFWLALRISDLIDVSASLRQPRIRYCLALFVCVVLVFLSTNDAKDRYSARVMDEAINFKDPLLTDWAPQANSLIYSNTMKTFYMHYFAYPHADWKYVVGFESALMPEEDLTVLRNLRYNYGHFQEYEPWVKKMRPQDRMITRAPVPGLEGIEWVQAARSFYIGRRKLNGVNAADSASVSETSVGVASTSTLLFAPIPEINSDQSEYELEQ
ncbi:MAG: hypothetical protein CVV42_07170 [Candidatus Riflebacteria bacterium HGW-Riflebacteria-2]|jgi:hypothetical protein|nr:MAG: hypothetical protein CVV42_07170 [Candidatus Riflebacteria bacterium HGW-Riflebacteria-2]